MLGQDQLPTGAQITARPPLGPQSGVDQYNWIQSVNLALITTPPAGPLGVVANQYDWPNPRAPQQAALGWTWRQTGMLGMDRLPAGVQVSDRPVLPIQRILFDWIQATDVALLSAIQLPRNQYDWPVPRGPQQATASWVWNQITMLGKDILPNNQKDWPYPPLGPFQPDRGFGWNNTAIRVPPPVLPINYKRAYSDLPPYGPFQPDRSFIYISPFIPPAPPPVFGASYFLLQPHYINDNYYQAWTVVTEGREIPFGWPPTLMVDPLNAQAVAAFYAAGPRTGYQGPGYDWQGWQNFDINRQAAIQKPITHWFEASPGMFKLTGLGVALPPVGV
jgi:hypothetical protein